MQVDRFGQAQEGVERRAADVLRAGGIEVILGGARARGR